MSGSDDPVRVSSASKRAMEILERRIDRTEAQIEGLRDVRTSVIWKAVPFMGILLAAVFGMLGWDLGEPIAGIIALVLVGSLVLFGVGAHLGIRRGERRLEEIETEYAEVVRDLTPGPAGRQDD